MTLSFYVSRLVAVRVLAALAGLVGLMQIVDMLDHVDTLLASEEGAYGGLMFVLWRLPAIVEQVLPMAMLGGCLFAWFGLVRTNELVAMRSAGLTGYHLARQALPVAVAVAGIQFVLADQLVPWTESHFKDWWRTVEAQIGEAKPYKYRRVWMRAGDLRIAAATGQSDASQMQDLTFIWVGENGAVAQRMEAGRAEEVEGRWRLHDVRIIRPREGSVDTRRAETLSWPLALPAPEVKAVLMGRDQLSTAQLVAVLSGKMPAVSPDWYYSTLLYRNFSQLLNAPLLLLLTMPAAFGSARMGGAAWGLLLGGILGIASLVVQGLFVALGQAGHVPPLLAAWAPTVAFACIGATVLLKFEEP